MPGIRMLAGELRGGELRIALIASRFNEAVVERLVRGAIDALGAVTRGETAHFDYVAAECAAGLARVALDTGAPVAFGVLTTDTEEQALERSGGAHGTKGADAALAALELASPMRKLAS